MCDSPKKKRAKQGFREAWLKDDRFKSWLKKVEDDPELFYCIFCKERYSCDLSHIIRHEKSRKHKRNKDKTLNNNNENSDNTERLTKNRTFCQQWLEIDLLKPWLREVPHNANLFFCLMCNKTFLLSCGGLSCIYRHAESETHVKCSKNYIPNEDANMLIDETLLSFEERIKSAEIRYAALIAAKNIPPEIANDILNFFQEVGKDSNVLKKMRMGKTKCMNIISNVLCPVETDRVVNNLQNNKFSILIDETSDICNEKWMTFIVRYVDSQTLNIRSQLVKLINIDAKDSSAQKLFDAFKTEMYKLEIPFLNIISLSCDNASVMTGKHESFRKKLQDSCKNLLTLRCPCHSAALVARAACAKIPEYCEEFLKKIINFINGSPKRSAIFKEFSENTNHKILKLSDTRWLSYHTCVERLLEHWNSIKLFLIEMTISEKSNSAEYLYSMMQNHEIKAYLLFLSHILKYFNDFNVFFQAVETKIHLLQPKSVEFLETVCKHFLKPQLSENLNYNNIQFSEKEYQKSLHEVKLGLECEKYLDTLMKEGQTDVVIHIREKCLQFYVVAAEEICKRLPVNDRFLSKLQVFQPNVALLDTNRETSFNDVSFIAKILGDFDETELRKEWFLLHLDFSTVEKENLSILSFDDMWKEILQHPSSTINKYHNLKSLVNAIRSLPNSNADPERLFSILSDIKTKKRNRLSSKSINALCVLKSALRSRQEHITDMEINEKHLSFMTATKLYARNNVHNVANKLTIYPADDENVAGSSFSNKN